MRLALLLRHTSAQTYKLVLENFPIPSLPSLKKLKGDNIDVLNVCKYLRENDKISDDLVIIVIKMSLRKSVKEGELFKVPTYNLRYFSSQNL